MTAKANSAILCACQGHSIPLIRAAAQGDVEEVRTLITRGSDLNARDALVSCLFYDYALQ